MAEPSPTSSCRARRRPRGPRRLFWRVYLHGVMLIVLVVVAIAVVGRTIGPPGPYHVLVDRFAGWLATTATVEDPARLQRELDRVHQQLGLRISVYQGRQSRLVASSIQPPLRPLSEEARRELRSDDTTWTRGRFAIALRGGDGGYVLVEAPHHGAFTGKALTVLLAVLCVLAVGSLPLVRWILGPLERLTAAAQRLGGGDLSARSGIARRDEVGQLAGAFDEMAGQLDRLLTSERQLLADISHELRTPLARIRVALELAAEEGEGGPCRNKTGGGQRFLGEIGADLAELETLLEDVLTAARLDLAAGASERALLRPERLEATTIIERAVSRFGERHPDRELLQQSAAELPAVQADPRLLPRVIENLLDNAHKYSPADQPVTLAARAADEGWLEIAVSDRGPGIGAEELARLFEPFFRGDPSRTRDTGGVGLGLTLAKRIVEAHGGAISAESAPGGGTTVRFRVPAVS